jgi:Zn-dependent peptidase ImmA (M78 family)/DNA-binding XRE family transcriptional regulator
MTSMRSLSAGKPQATPTMTVNGDRIRQAREIKRLTQAELAAAIGVDQSTVARYERNVLQPPEAQLEAIAIATGFRTAFFRRDAGPEFSLGSLTFRRRAALLAQDRDRVRQFGRLIYEAAALMAERFRSFEIRIPAADPRMTPDDAARATRNVLGLSPDSPVVNLVRRLEKNGVFIFALPFEIDEHDAYSLWADSDPRRPVVVFSAGKPGDRLRFNIAHELGHLVMHRTYGGGIPEKEQEAQLFASEFLLPAEAMTVEFRAPVTLTQLAELKGKWGVSMQALLMRAWQLKIVSDRQRKYLFQQIMMRGWRAQEPVPIAIERPRLFRKLAELIYGVPVDPAKVARLIDAPPTLIRQTLDQHATSDHVRATAVIHPVSQSEVERTSAVLEFQPKEA